MNKGLIFTLDALLLAAAIIAVCFPLIYLYSDQKSNINTSEINTTMMTSYYTSSKETYIGTMDRYCEKITDYNTQLKIINTRIICEEKS